MIILEQLDFAGRPKTPVIRQAEASECGLACLAMVACYHGLNVDLITLRQRFPISLKGSNLKQLMVIGEELGFAARPLRGEVGELAHVTLPAILHWNFNHFVVLTRVRQTLGGIRYHVNDPARGQRVIGEAEFARQFTGIILELTKSERFQPKVERTRLRISQLWSRMEGFWPTLRQIFLLSVALQLLSLAAPFFLQISIDTVLPGLDTDLLLMLALGFGGVAVVSVLTTWVRALVLLRLGTSLSYQIVINLFRQLMRLPLQWFEKRHVGDVVSRFSSTKSISDLLSQGLIAALVDGIMALATFALMLVYSPALSLLALTALILTICLRFGFISALQQASVSMIATNARESSAFIETIRGIATLKAFGEESNRQRYWQQKKADALNAEIKTGRLNASFNAGEQLVMAVERVLFVYIAIRYAMSGALSVGMIFALQSYRQQFLDATSRVVQQGINYRLLDMHLTRIADIALSPTEPIPLPGHSSMIDIDDRQPVRIELRGVRFAYAPSEPEILAGVDLVIEPGEMVALIGPSGGGKTTLLKIMMGLLMPTAGEVLVDGTPLLAYGLMRWRQRIASVAQDDSLFAGSLSDNITLFDTEPDSSLLKASALQASCHADILAMPMQYHSLVGDMGSTLSGGQRQRVLLARALYRNPVALFLDEATSNLDWSSEKRIVDALSDVACTRIISAHRPQAIEGASRVLTVSKGSIALGD